MSAKPRMNRESLLAAVVESIEPRHHTDKPLIRQTINDTADAYRKAGYIVPDYAQAKMVRDVQTHLMVRL